MSATRLNKIVGEIENNLDRILDNIENSSKLFIQTIEAIEKMPMMTRATAAAGTMTESENLNDVEQGHDVQDARMTFTIDSAGRRFNAESAVPIHSCINIATQTGGDDDERSNCGVGRLCQEVDHAASGTRSGWNTGDCANHPARAHHQCGHH